MNQSSLFNNYFSIIIGSFFFIAGLWGLSSHVVFGILTTNTTHAMIHILLGSIAIISGIRQHAKSFCIFLGWLLVVAGIFRFIPGLNSIVINLLNVNKPVACFNIAAGILSLASAASSERINRA